jgi:hypothetical protein
MNEAAAMILSVLDDLEIDRRKTSIVAIGNAEFGSSRPPTVHAYELISGPDDLPQSLKAELGIVVAPLDFMPSSNAEQLLSRLRDVHCYRVLLLDTEGHWTPETLRPLGYLEVECPSVAGRCYLYDPEVFNQLREWNNSSDWANPENFQKYRW